MTLAVKYRPKNFNEVIGQDVIVRILTNQIETNTHKNAYLFTGASGCGKTTCAKIFAEQLNGGTDGIKIIDAASNNYKENILSIIEDCRNLPLFSKYKIYILDEVHLFSSNGWSSLLELLENTPEYVKIIMCTTEPNKIFHTVFSRVLRFNFARISNDLIKERLKEIADIEYPFIKITDAALTHIGNLANGSMREAISQLEFCMGYVDNSTTTLTFENVLEITGKQDYNTMLGLLYDIKTNAKRSILITINHMFQNGVDLNLLLDDLITTAFSVFAVKTGYYPQDLNIPRDIDKDIFEYEDIERIITLLLKIKNDIKYVDNPKNIIIGGLMSF